MIGTLTRSRAAWCVALLALLALLLACAPDHSTSPPSAPLGAVATATAQSQATVAAQVALAGAPIVDPDYIFNQLDYMATSFQHRVAGYDDNLPVRQNGHDEFAAYWTQQMQHLLQGFGAQVRRDSFPLQGWTGQPAVVPGVNVEVTVPGVSHPDQIVVIGCHYDSEATSTQSANDDASGCAIELGVARAMAGYWLARHVSPARTLRFVLFDAEEQGLFGSYHYVNSTIAGDLPNVVAMFNEEQSGIAYPLRFLGKASNPLLPLMIDTAFQNDSAAEEAFRALSRQAIPVAFAAFRAIGIQTATYTSTSGQPVTKPIFTPDQTTNVQIADGSLAGSDELPFIAAGVPQATFGGNASYYQTNPPPPAWSYPFDQPQDTIQLMDTFANDTAQRAPTLTLALALPAELTVWMLDQPAVLGEAPATGGPLAAIGDIGQPLAGHPLSLTAQAMAASATAGAALTYGWTFGDGATGSGATVTHTYAQPGSYTLTLSVRESAGATSVVTKSLIIVAQATTYPNPYAGLQQDGAPPANPLVTLPTPSAG